jgi:hypothetical protein
MRKLSSVVGAALLAVTTFATPANAQTPTASGSCGAFYGQYGMTDVNSSQVNDTSDQVNMVFLEINYSGVPAPNRIGIIVRYNDELEGQSNKQSFTIDSSGGSKRLVLFSGVGTVSQGGDVVGFTGPSPESAPGGNSLNQAIFGRSDSAGGGPGINQSGNRANSGARGISQNSPTGGQIAPGDYVVYIYTGTTGDIYNVKDGTVERGGFIADEKGYLGKFSCGVSTDEGSGPG